MGTYDTRGGSPRSPNVEEEEALNALACCEAAVKAGFTIGQAENCESGQLQCPTCPWRHNRGEN